MRRLWYAPRVRFSSALKCSSSATVSASASSVSRLHLGEACLHLHVGHPRRQLWHVAIPELIVPERDHDPEVGTDLRRVVDAVRHGDPQLGRGGLHRAGREIVAPAAALVDPGDDEGDVETGRHEGA